MKIIGIDPSLTATGIAVIDTDDRLVVDTHTITSTGKADADLTERSLRLRDISGQVSNAVAGYGPDGNRWPRAASVDLVVIEAPSLGQVRQGGQLDRHGLWWIIVDSLIEHIDLVAVTPAQRAKYATGKGNAGKDEVLLAVAKRYPQADVMNNNEADALVLAAMGARLLGDPIEDALPAANLAALDKITLP